MPELILKIASQDAAFLDFYGGLAIELGDSGTVYTPYPKITPHARMAVPAPSDVLVVLDSVDLLAAVHRAARRYLEAGAGRALDLRAGEKVVRLSAADPLDAPALLERLGEGAGERP